MEQINSQQPETISVETALNSRCSSDLNPSPLSSHYGTIDPTTPLPEKAYEDLIHIGDSIPRFTKAPLRVYRDGNMLICSLSSSSTGIERDYLHIENGMQQYSILIACAAYGYGCRIREFGVDGLKVSDGWINTVNLLIGKLIPPYQGLCWTTEPPQSSNSWISGNLPDPKREGSVALLQIINQLSLEVAGDSQASTEAKSQLLWAARGRTPHYYHGTPWGMTVPVWVGQQALTSVYLVDQTATFRYVNWIGERPTHSITKIHPMNYLQMIEETSWPSQLQVAILMGTNDDRRVAQWEVGFEMEALILQATALGIPYQARLLTQNERNDLYRYGIHDALAAFLF